MITKRQLALTLALQLGLSVLCLLACAGIVWLLWKVAVFLWRLF